MQISRGRAISARPIATICCSPPDSVPATCSRRSRTRGNSPYTRSKSSRNSAPRARVYAPISRFSYTVIRGNSRRASSTGAIPRRTRSLVASRSIACPSNMTVPLVGRTTPMIVFIVVLFPHAFPPSRQTISPCPISYDTDFNTCRSP